MKLKAFLTNIHISSLVSNIVISASGFLSFILLSRNIPPTVFGSWILFLSLASFVDMIIMGLTQNAVIYYGCGEDDRNRHIVNASSLIAMFYIVCGITLLFWGIALFGQPYISSAWCTIFWAYPILGFCSLWRMSSLAYLQAKALYHHTITIRLISTLLFLALCGVLLITNYVSFINLIIIYIFSNAVSSFYGILRGWDSMKYVRHTNHTEIKKVINYGKYTLGTQLGASLLKSADVFVIGLSPIFGVIGVAIYSIPFKVVEFLEIPLRSLAMSSFNQISVLSKQKDYTQIARLFVRYNIVLFLISIPMLAFLALFPEFVLNILGGSQYHEYMDTMTTILYVIVAYGLLMIPDRMIGVTLEGIGKPAGNTVKTISMTLFNVIGNLVAVFIFHSLTGVAYVSLGFTLLGIIIGQYLISRSAVRPRFQDISRESGYIYQFIKNHKL